MSILGAFIGGAAKTRLADMQAADEDARALDRFKKQQQIIEEMRQKAEESRVAAKRMVLGGSADQGPQQLMVEEYNPSGRVIGTRPASKGEEEEHVLGKQTRAANLAAATAEAEAKARKESRDELKLRSQLETDKARQAASYASAESSRAYAKNLASPKGPDTFKDEGDLSYLISAKEGGDQIAAEYDRAREAGIAQAQQRGASPEQVQTFIRELTREYILKAKRLPNKGREGSTGNTFEEAMTK